MRKAVLKCFVLAIIACPVPSLGAAELLFDIRDYGAVPDGKTLNSQAIQRAIEACASQGGGTVYFPPGVWLTGTIELRNNITLLLESGCRVLGSPRPEDYPKWTPRVRSYSNNYTNQSLIRGEDLDNVAIRGRGTFDGNGGQFRWTEYKNRPYLIRLVNCRDVLVEDVSLRNSAMWMQQYLACRRVAIRGIRVNNHVTYNNDGLDLDSCRDVTVSDCCIDSDDDALCLKATTDRPCENVVVTNCRLSSHANAIKTGTESVGGFRNITISNCVLTSPRDTNQIYGVRRGMGGIALEIVDGGTLEGVAVSNITIDGVTTPIFLRLGNRARPVDKDAPVPGIGSFRNVVLSNIVATHASPVGCSISGIRARSIENVQLNNIQITLDGGGTRQQAARKPPEKEREYPESLMFGTLPAYGFFCRHVDGLKLHDVRLRTDAADLRHAIVADDVKNLVIDGLEVKPESAAAAAVRLIASPGAVVRNSGDLPVETNSP